MGVNMTLTMSFVRCLLCQGALPPTQDEGVIEHFQDQHRAYFNIDFLFNSSFLDEKDISKTLGFIISLNCVDKEKQSPAQSGPDLVEVATNESNICKVHEDNPVEDENLNKSKEEQEENID